MTTRRPPRFALVAVRLLAALLPAGPTRERYREQWAADVDGAAELGLSPLGVALGAARCAVLLTTTPPKGSTMLPVGPLAIALRRFGGHRQPLTAVALAVAFGMLLIGGLVTLIVG